MHVRHADNTHEHLGGIEAAAGGGKEEDQPAGFDARLSLCSHTFLLCPRAPGRVISRQPIA